MSKKTQATQAEPRFKTLSFLSDFGLVDEFVGVTKSVVYEIAPFARIVDVTHNIPPHNIRAGSLALARAAAYLCPGVVLAVVDPGVGSNRRAIAVEVGGGTSILLGPDNGLLAAAVALVGGPNRVVELTNTHYQLPQRGTTFAARDIFAPAAAHIMTGLEITELGAEVDPVTLTPQVIPVAQKNDAGDVTADVLWIDQFGNIQLNLEKPDLDELTAIDTKIQLRHTNVQQSDMVRSLNMVSNYLELKSQELGIMIDSYGLAAIVKLESSAADELGIKEGDEINLSAIKEIPINTN